MKKLIVDSQKVESLKLDLEEAFALLCISCQSKDTDCIKSLESKGLIYEGEITDKGKKTIKSFAVYKEEETLPLDLEVVAKGMKELFPKGKRPNTNTYWTDSCASIVERLKTFFKKFPIKITENELINATKVYVESFNGDYTYMRNLKYFIYRQRLSMDGEKEESSELMETLDRIQNKEEMSDSTNSEWTAELK